MIRALLLVLALLASLAAHAGPLSCLPEGWVPGGTGVAVQRGGNALGGWVGGYCPRPDGLGWRAEVLVWPHAGDVSAAAVAAVRSASDPLAAVNAALAFDCSTTTEAGPRALCDAAFADVRRRTPPPMFVTSPTSWGATCGYTIRADGRLDTSRCAVILPIGSACRCDIWALGPDVERRWCWSAQGMASDCRRAR